MSIRMHHTAYTHHPTYHSEYTEEAPQSAGCGVEAAELVHDEPGEAREEGLYI